VPTGDLSRFVTAQDPIYEDVVAELRSGHKTGHWMWFVFPQIAGLGYSGTASRYAVESLDEARSYLTDPVLGPRLVECARVVDELPGRSAHAVFGAVDALKLRSSMTLFCRADPSEPVFQRVLDHYFGGVADAATDRILAGVSSSGT
jgi:uncharacterized protein (DUF1810 family)